MRDGSCVLFFMLRCARMRDIVPYLSLLIQSEMNAFDSREVLTGTWLRALSRENGVVASSDRTDHGPNGAYDGWPPTNLHAHSTHSPMILAHTTCTLGTILLSLLLKARVSSPSSTLRHAQPWSLQFKPGLLGPHSSN